jgi:hypothetical protein
MPRLPLSLAVVGVDFPNKKGPTRRFEVEICQPGEPVEIKPEPSNRFDENAVAVFSCRGIQIGYLPSERAAYISLLFRRGVEIRAIFQERTSWGAAVRLAFEGEEPQLPPKREDDSGSDWWPDESA